MGHFILKERSIVLHKSDPEKDRLPQISGDVGQLDDGRLFARWEVQGEGGPVLVCREWSEGEDVRKIPRPGVVDVWAWQRMRFESFKRGWLRWNRNAEPNERAKFAEQWPEVSVFLGVAPQPEHWLVDIGDVYYEREFSVPKWREFLDRHSVGDYGLYGQHPEEPLTHSQAWIVPLQPSVLQARHAVDTGRGVIRSRWVLPKEAQSQFPKQGYMTVAAYTVDITTVYAAAGRRTLVEPVAHINGIADESEST